MTAEPLNDQDEFVPQCGDCKFGDLPYNCETCARCLGRSHWEPKDERTA